MIKNKLKYTLTGLTKITVLSLAIFVLSSGHQMAIATENDRLILLHQIPQASLASQFEVSLDPKGNWVKVTYSDPKRTKGSPTSKNFGPKVFAALKDIWPNPGTDLKTWTSDATCLDGEIWTVSLNQAEVHICTDDAKLNILTNYQEALWVLMQAN